jgi:hypothetical protein
MENITIAFKSRNRIEAGEKTLCRDCTKVFIDMMKDRVQGNTLCRYGKIFILDWDDVDFIVLTDSENNEKL